MKILFVKSQRRPAPLSEPAQERDYSMNFNHPATAHQYNLIVKAMHEGRVSVNDAVRAGEAYVGGKPLPHDLIRIVAGEG